MQRLMALSPDRRQRSKAKAPPAPQIETRNSSPPVLQTKTNSPASPISTPTTPKFDSNGNFISREKFDFASFADSIGVGTPVDEQGTAEPMLSPHERIISIDFSEMNFSEDTASPALDTFSTSPDNTNAMLDESSTGSELTESPRDYGSDDEDQPKKRPKPQRTKSIFETVYSVSEDALSSAIEGTKKGTKMAVGGVVNTAKYAVDGTKYVAKGTAKMAVSGTKGVIKGTKAIGEGIGSAAESTYSAVRRTGEKVTDFARRTLSDDSSSNNSFDEILSDDTQSDPNLLDDSEFEQVIHDVESEVEKLKELALPKQELKLNLGALLSPEKRVPSGSILSPRGEDKLLSPREEEKVENVQVARRSRGLAVMREKSSDSPPLSPRTLGSILSNRKSKPKNMEEISPKQVETPSGMKADLIPFSYYSSCHKSQSLAPLYTRKNMRKLRGIVEPSSQSNFIVDDHHVIRAGTLDKLIEAVTNHNTYDNEFLDVFVLTYRSFTTPEELLDKLITRYNTPPPIPPHLEKPSDEIEVSFSHHDDRISVTLEERENDYSSVNHYYMSHRELFVQFVKTYLFRIRMRVSIVLKNWMERHFADFREDTPARKKLQDFIFREMPSSNMISTAERLRKLYEGNAKRRDTFTAQQIQKLKEMHELHELTEKSKNKFFSSNHFKLQLSGHKIINTLSVDSLQKLPLHMFKSTDLIHSLTIIQFGIFQKIRPKEFLNQSWMKSDKRTKAPNIFNSIQRSNQIGMWVATEILSVKDTKDRSKVLQKFIKCALKCEKIRNFNTMLDIISGLNSNPIHRLAKTWANVDSSYRDQFKRLTELANPKKSYAALRAATKEGGVPCMPYIGMHLTDVLFIEDGNKDKTKEGLINFTKRRLLGGVLRDIQVYQQMPYDLVEQPQLRTRLQTLKFRDLDALLDVSQSLEPPVIKKKKVVKEETK